MIFVLPRARTSAFICGSFLSDQDSDSWAIVPINATLASSAPTLSGSGGGSGTFSVTTSGSNTSYSSNTAWQVGAIITDDGGAAGVATATVWHDMTPPEPWPFDCNPWPVPDGATATVAVTLYDPFLSPGGMVWGSIGN